MLLYSAVAVRAHLGSDAAFRTYSTSSSTGRRAKPPSSSGGVKNKPGGLEALLAEECPELPPLLAAGAAGVAGWAEVCGFLGVAVPSSYSTGEGRWGGQCMCVCVCMCAVSCCVMCSYILHSLSLTHTHE
jgi:hypothetical protein